MKLNDCIKVLKPLSEIGGDVGCEAFGVVVVEVGEVCEVCVVMCGDDVEWGDGGVKWGDGGVKWGNGGVEWGDGGGVKWCVVIII